MEEVRLAFPCVDSSEQWCNVFLRQVDYRIGSGESTAVVVDVRSDRVFGASVGDSEAWAVSGSEIKVLTSRQQRKPLLGTGEAVPVGFDSKGLDGLLIVATDGFCNYVKREEMLRIIPYEDFVVLPRRLVDMVLFGASGELNDDASIVLCRYKRPSRGHNNVLVLRPEDFA